MVYLKLQPYRQHSLRKMRNQKLSPKFYGPYPVEAKVGQVAYRLKLPEGTRIHPTFHVSQLKKHVGSAIHSPTLPPVGTGGSVLKEPTRIIDRRMIKKGESSCYSSISGVDKHISGGLYLESLDRFSEAISQLRSLRTRICLRRGVMIWVAIRG